MYIGKGCFIPGSTLSCDYTSHLYRFEVLFYTNSIESIFILADFNMLNTVISKNQIILTNYNPLYLSFDLESACSDSRLA